MRPTWLEERWAKPTAAGGGTLQLAFRVRGGFSAARAEELLQRLLQAPLQRRYLHPSAARPPGSPRAVVPYVQLGEAPQGGESGTAALRLAVQRHLSSGAAGGEEAAPVQVVVVEIDAADHLFVLFAPATEVHVGELAGCVFESFSGAAAAGNPEELPEGPTRTDDAARAFWQRTLSPPLPALNLRWDRPRPLARSGRRGRVEVRLEPRLSAELLQLAERMQTEPLTLFVTGLGCFLSRYAGQNELVLTVLPGVARGMRRGSATRRWTPWLPLRLELEESSAFSTVAQQLEAASNESLMHGVPGSALFQELLGAEAAALPFHPLSSVLVTALQQPPGTAAPSDVSLFRVELGIHDSDLTFLLIGSEGSLSLDVTYDADLLDEETVRRAVEHLTVFLGAALHAPEEAYGRHPLLTRDEQRRILQDWNDTRQDYPAQRTLDVLFQEQAAKTPEAIAVQLGTAQLTYRELSREATLLAEELAATGLPPGSFVGLYSEPSLELVIGLMAILEAGYAYLPLDPRYPADRLQYMVEHARVTRVLTAPELIDSAPFDRSLCQPLKRGQGAKAAAKSRASSTHDCYVIYTSGSTGKPKGVEIQHQALVNFMTYMKEKLVLAPSDRVLAITSLCFDISTLELFLPLLCGARIVLVDRDTSEDGSALLSTLRQQGVTVVQTTPTRWRMLMDAGLGSADGVRLGLCGGEALPVDLARRMRAGVETVWNVYGPTEATVWCAMHRVDRDYEQSVPIGRPFANTQLLIINAFDQINPPGVPGELLIGGDCLARGYLERPELTAERFVHKPWIDGGPKRFYRTGDLARWLPDGTVEYVSRIDRQIKLRGFRIELGEIESVLRAHPGVKDACVVVRPDPAGDNILVGYTVSRFGFHETCRLTTKGGPPLQVRARELSLSGMHLALPSGARTAPLHVGDKVTLEVLEAPESMRSRLEASVARLEAEEVVLHWEPTERNLGHVQALMQAAQREDRLPLKVKLQGTLTPSSGTAIEFLTEELGHSSLRVSLRSPELPERRALRAGEPLRLSLATGGTPAGPAFTAALQEETGGTLRLALTLTPESEELWRELCEPRHFVSRRVPYYMVPSYVVPLDALPLTPAKKVDVKALPSPVLGVQTAAAPAKEDGLASELEKSIARIWAAELRLAHVEHDRSFQELGGHSLALARIITRIRGELGLNLSIRTLTPSTTVKDMAMTLERKVPEQRVAPEPEPAGSGQTWRSLGQLGRAALPAIVALAIVCFLIRGAAAGGGGPKAFFPFQGRVMELAQAMPQIAQVPRPVLVWGTSSTAHDISPTAMEKTLGGAQAFNLGVVPGISSMQRVLVEHLAESYSKTGNRARVSVIELHPIQSNDVVSRAWGAMTDVTLASVPSPVSDRLAFQKDWETGVKMMVNRHYFGGTSPGVLTMIPQFMMMLTPPGWPWETPRHFNGSEGIFMDREAMISHLSYDPVSEWRFAYRGGPPPLDASPGWQKMLEEQQRIRHWHHEGEGRGVIRDLLALYASLEDPPRADPLDSEGGRDLVAFVQRVKSVSDHTILFVTPWHPAYRKTGADRAEMERKFERLAEVTQVTLLKETYDEPSLTSEYFFDIDHLTPLGRERFSELLGARIQALTAGSPASRTEVP